MVTTANNSHNSHNSTPDSDRFAIRVFGDQRRFAPWPPRDFVHNLSGVQAPRSDCSQNPGVLSFYEKYGILGMSKKEPIKAVRAVGAGA